jgi:hypothetical protein
VRQRRKVNVNCDANWRKVRRLFILIRPISNTINSLGQTNDIRKITKVLVILPNSPVREQIEDIPLESSLALG